MITYNEKAAIQQFRRVLPLLPIPTLELYKQSPSCSGNILFAHYFPLGAFTLQTSSAVLLPHSHVLIRMSRSLSV